MNKTFVTHALLLTIAFCTILCGCPQQPKQKPQSIGKVQSVQYGHYCTIINTEPYMVVVRAYHRVPLGVELYFHQRANSLYDQYKVSWADANGTSHTLYVRDYQH